MKCVIKNKKGFTLLELIVVITIIGMVITTVMGIVVFGYRVFGMSSKEHSLQYQVKLSLEQISSMVRESKAVFAIPNTGYHDEEWNYIAVSEDKTRIQSIRWNPSSKQHDFIDLVGPFEDITFKIGFDKQDSMSKDNTLRMYYEAYTHDGTVQRFDIKSGYVAFNALQVVDYGTKDNVSEVLAYRSDNFNYENFELIVNIAMILDVSGSMDYTLGNSRDTRISVLRLRTKELMEQFAQNKNDGVSINISLIPFSHHANDHTDFYNVKDNAQRTLINNKITNLRAVGSTNTGDGIRQAYFKIKNKNETLDFPKKIEKPDTIIKNYVIILVDGDSNKKSYSVDVYQECRIESVNVGSWWWPIYEDREVCYRREKTNDYYIGGPESVVEERTIRDSDIGKTLYFYVRSQNTGYGDNYVNATSKLIEGEEFTNYLIAFSDDPTASKMLNINKAIGNEGRERLFDAKNEAELGLAFSDIHLSITNDIWHFLGPKLVEDGD